MMLTKLIMKNFKRFDYAEVNLEEHVVLIGPNNAGKTTALQALALWDIGYSAWVNKRGVYSAPSKRVGVAINRRDLIAIPVPSANLLWYDKHVRATTRNGGKQRTDNIRIDIIVEGITQGKPWECGFEFDYNNEEALYCRPLRTAQEKGAVRMPVPELTNRMNIVFLPPMSGLADREFLKQPGEIGVLLGQGQTAQVLRNLCYRVYQNEALAVSWTGIVDAIQDLFGVELLEPELRQTAEIILGYKETSGQEFDLSAAGRGLQQTLLLLSYLYANPKSVLLLDEPDAHLEILRQREIYNLITRTADAQGSQIIAASHSEIILNEAATKNKVVAFVGKPHDLTGRGAQVLKSLKSIGFDQYYQAEQRGWVLYVEDATDLAILQAFADLLNHPAVEVLKSPFVHYVATNLPSRAREHFQGVKEAKGNLVGIALFDRLDKELRNAGGLIEVMWKKREIENYFCNEDVLYQYARDEEPNDLFGFEVQSRREQAMKEAIDEVQTALKTFGKPDAWSDDIKASDEVLEPIFRLFSEKLDIPLVERKRTLYKLIPLMPPEKIDEEVAEKLDLILNVARQTEHF